MRRKYYSTYLTRLAKSPRPSSAFFWDAVGEERRRSEFPLSVEIVRCRGGKANGRQRETDRRPRQPRSLRTKLSPWGGTTKLTKAKTGRTTTRREEMMEQRKRRGRGRGRRRGKYGANQVRGEITSKQALGFSSPYIQGEKKERSDKGFLFRNAWTASWFPFFRHRLDDISPGLGMTFGLMGGKVTHAFLLT